MDDRKARSRASPSPPDDASPGTRARTTATADRYMHFSPDHLRSAVDSLEAALGLKTDSSANSAPATPAAPDGMLSAVKELGG